VRLRTHGNAHTDQDAHLAAAVHADPLGHADRRAYSDADHRAHGRRDPHPHPGTNADERTHDLAAG
jgi:hypothetical protein